MGNLLTAFSIYKLYTYYLIVTMKCRITALLALIIGFASLQSCNYAARDIYTSRSFKTVARQHKTIAILPFDVQISLRPKDMKKLTPEEHYKLELLHGRAVQSSLQMHFLNKINAKREVIAVQDVNITNAILEEKDIQPEELANYSPIELAQLLGVDAVLMGSLVTEKPLSNGAALALAAYSLLFTQEISNGGPTNAGTTDIRIFDGSTGNLLWSYHKVLGRSLGSDTHSIVKAITRKASKKIPYNRLEPKEDSLILTQANNK